jgi:peroxiredoxin
MKSYIYLILIPILLLGGVTAYGGTNGTTLVKGKILNSRSTTIKLTTVADYITHEPMEYTVDLKGDFFEFEISVDEAKLATIYHGNSSIQVFLEPKQDIEMTFDAWDMISTIQFTGVGSDNNKYLNQANQRFARLNDDYVIFKMASLNSEEFQVLMREKKNEKENFLLKAKTTMNFTKVFADYAQADVDYWWAHHLMRFRWEHAFYNDIPPPMDLPREYFDFLKEININNDGAVTNEKYLYFLDQYLEFQNARVKRIVGPGYKAPKYRGAEEFLTGKAKFFTLANEFYLKCKSKQTYTIGNDVRRFLEESPYENYNSLVRSEYRNADGLEAGSPAPNFSLVNMADEVVSLNDFKGKVVYVDFWATWCVPCTYEIMRSKDLKKKFQGREVVFLYISLDTNSDSWRNFLNKHELQGVHLFARNVYNSDVATEYGVRGLPSFFLIDKSGNLARVPAKRSSEPGVVTEINEVLSR